MKALVTGGCRGIGAAIAQRLTYEGWDVVITARSEVELRATAARIGASWRVLDVTDHQEVEGTVLAEHGPFDLLVANAGLNGDDGLAPSWEIDPAQWWRIFEANVLGVHNCCRAVIPGMLASGSGRIVITGSGAAHLPGIDRTAYPPSKAAICRYAETLANELAGRIPVFCFDPGLVRTAMTEHAFPADTNWASPEHAATLVRRLATGRYDALSGRMLHAVDDNLDELLARAERIVEDDLNVIRLRK